MIEKAEKCGISVMTDHELAVLCVPGSVGSSDMGLGLGQAAKGEPLKNSLGLQREIETLRDRMARLSAAILRISTTLDLDAVLGEIIESARALTGAVYGVITTIDVAGRPQDFVTSGFTPEERRHMEGWSDRLRLFEHFRDLPGTLRGSDMAAYVRSAGFPALKWPVSFQITPMSHHGVHVGTFFLGGKEGQQEFTSEDEEVLELFAAQAATAVANARTHRDERRARADVEALVDASPVGVVVFDARIGHLRSLNPEAKRITGTLRLEGQSDAQLAEAITCRLTDGREFTLDQLSSAETLRAEEVVLAVPDGRNVTALLNCTPIRSDDGQVESVVVTVQDLAPFEEVERLRAEFLGMVSHELRAPLTSIKGSTTTVLNASRVVDPAEVRQFIRIIDQQADHMDHLISDLLDAGRIDAGTLSMAPEPTELTTLVDQARNTFLSSGYRHHLRFNLPRDLPRVMADRERIVQVLNNLLSNAAKNSPESSPVEIAAVRDGVYIAISVTDLGSGVPEEQLPHLFRKHAAARGGGKSGLRGSGLGLAICKGLVEAHGGRIRAASGGEGLGTRITFTVPVASGADAEPSSDSSPLARTEPSPTRILVVDDDPQALHYIREALTEAGYSLLLIGDADGLPELIRAEKPGLVLLDLMLPGSDGIELMHIVPELSDLPVIFISGYGRDETIARALEAGATDYIVKPFSPTELTARVRAALRRSAAPEPFVLGDLVIHYDQRRVSVAGQPVELTATEYDLLRILSLNPGRVLTYGTLLRQVWRVRGDNDTARVRSFMMKLRRKLGDPVARSSYILNERGIGYRMPRPDERRTLPSS